MFRVTILCNKYDGHPKGFAYVEFTDKDSVQTAMALDDSLFRGRQIKVCGLSKIESFALNFFIRLCPREPTSLASPQPTDLQEEEASEEEVEQGEEGLEEDT